VAVGVTILVVTLFAVVGGLDGDTGASSPLAAVQRLQTAIDDSDPAAALAAMSPNEVSDVASLVNDVQQKAAALGYTSGGTTVAGVNLNVVDPVYTVEQLGPDVAKVIVDSGSLEYQIDEGKLSPIWQDLGARQATGSISAQRLVIPPRIYEQAPIEPFVMVDQENGGWYVSPYLTAAEYVDEIEGWTPGDFSEPPSVPTNASASPDAAVQALTGSLNGFDPLTVLGDLPPQFGVLGAYQAAITGLSTTQAPAGTTGTLGNISIDTSGLTFSDYPLSNGDTKVVIDNGTVTINATDRGEPTTFTASWDGRCGEWANGSDTPDRHCLPEWWLGKEVSTLFVVAVPVAGGWVVSPFATLLEYERELLANVTRPFADRFLGLTHLASPTITLTPGSTQNLTLDDAGSATVVLSVPQSGTYVFSLGGDVQGRLYQGSNRYYEDVYSQEDVPLKRGSGAVLVLLDNNWDSEPASVEFSTAQTSAKEVGRRVELTSAGIVASDARLLSRRSLP
jgi:hypothetical protein